MTVLIVDDSMFMRNIIEKILKQHDIKVIGEATNGREAVEQYKKLLPDIVTMDLTMPDMKGIDAIKLIKKEYPAAKIIVCSSMGQKDFIKDAIDAGARGFIVKPFEEDDLIREISKIMHN